VSPRSRIRSTMMRVGDVMSRQVMAISASSSCYEAALRMSRLHIHHLPVLGEGDVVEGVVTDRDLRTDLFLLVAGATESSPVDVEQALRQRRVRDVMSIPPVTVSPDDELASGVRIMAERKISSVPVTDDGRLVGILTDTDVLRILFRRRLFCSADVEAILLTAS
jgi:acetoin utilization protein AcuB